MLDSTPLFFSLLHVPTSVFDALSQALQAYIDGSDLFYKLYFLPIVNGVFTTMINTLTALEKAVNDSPLPGSQQAGARGELGRRTALAVLQCCPSGRDPSAAPRGERHGLAGRAAREREPRSRARDRRRQGERR